jgi:3-hydroxyisobutyrate dehydrogenase-like beta-hydroxyacid dehydrogenase
MQKQTLGFIGVGKMGAPMATRFLDAGYPVCVCDPQPDAVARMRARGATSADSPAGVASAAETVFMCLPKPEVVRSVALGDRGLIHGSSIRTLIDLGTTGPAMERSIAADVASRGMALVDSPVTGGIAGAAAGTLAVIVACSRKTLAEVEPILANLGRVYYTGETPGLAQTAKLVNNLLSAVALAASAEAMAMGVKAGLDPRVLLDIINAGSGRNSATQDKFPRAILTGTFDFGMSTELFCKDVRLCVDEAESLGVPMVMGSAARQMFAVTQAAFGPASDFTSIARVIEGWAGVTMRA